VPTAKQQSSRMPLLDAFKAIACLLIVAHHLAVYGPMSDVAYPLMPTVIDWLYQYGRMAVQVFFVVSGFLVACKLAPEGVPRVLAPGQLVVQRYLRLAIPYLAALTLSIVCAALARMLMTHESVPDIPSFTQLLAHVFLLQDWLDQDALSAGVWYIAIDFQLFALTMFLFMMGGRIGDGTWTPIMVLGLVAASLFIFNRDPLWDETALYFYGSYGLGMLAYWAGRARAGSLYLLMLTGLVGAALWLAFRERIAVAGVVMLVLALAQRSGALQRWEMPAALNHLGKISFSIFLVHFPLLLLVNGLVTYLFPQQLAMNVLGMVLGVAVSIWGGALFYRKVECYRHSGPMHLAWPAGFLASGLLASSLG